MPICSKVSCSLTHHHITQSQSHSFHLPSTLFCSCTREPKSSKMFILVKKKKIIVCLLFSDATFFSVFLPIFNLAGNCGQRRQQQDPLFHHPFFIQAINISRGGFLFVVCWFFFFLLTSSLLPVWLAQFPIWERALKKKKKTLYCRLATRLAGRAD